MILRITCLLLRILLLIIIIFGISFSLSFFFHLFSTCFDTTCDMFFYCRPTTYTDVSLEQQIFFSFLAQHRGFFSVAY